MGKPETKEKGGQIIAITQEIRAAAEKFVNASTEHERALKSLDNYQFPRPNWLEREEKRKDHFKNNALGDLYRAVIASNPDLPYHAFGIDGRGYKDMQHRPTASHTLRRDVKLAINDVLNGLLKEIATEQGVTAPHLPDQIPSLA